MPLATNICSDWCATDDDFAALTRVLLDIADTHAKGRLVSVLEGGYHQAGLASAVKSHLGALMA